ncbi:MAG: M48 family metalloprotease [Planctomycetes bacterium]|nr:M48 family metalloprotease [Planctomycetota bacterium]
MIVQIIIITIGFVIALSYPIGIEPLWFFPADSGKALMPTLGIILSSVFYIMAGFRLVRRQIRKNLRNYYKQVFSYRLSLLFIYFAQVYIFHLPALISGHTGFLGLGSGEIPFVTKFLTLTPFLLTLILSYIPFYWIEKFISKSQPTATTTGSPSLSNFLIFQIRTYFMLAVLPLFFFILVFDVIYAIPTLRNIVITYPFTEWLTSILLLLTMYIFTPFVLKYLWVTKPLPEGSLRIYLQSIAFRANIKIRDFLIWEVGRRPFANALLIGIFPFNRFVIFTDSIIRNLSDDEIAAVFSHEVGHAKFKHLLILLLFTVAYLSILFTLSSVFESALGNGAWNFGFSLTLIMIFWLVLFGQLSRRFELQADWFAAEITADPDSFTRALTKIAYLNGIPMHTSGLSTLTHPSIDQRITSIRNKNLFASSQLRTTSRIMMILVISGALGLAGVGYTIIKEIKSAPQRQLKIKAFEMTRKAYSLLAGLEKEPSQTVQLENLKTCVSYINTAIVLDPQNPFNYIIKGDALGYSGQNYHQESQLNYRKAYNLKPTDPTERYYLSQKLSN